MQNGGILDGMSDAPKNLIRQYPAVGILASVGGFVTSLSSLTAQVSVFIGFIGAVFGCIAGYYTMRVQCRKWRDRNR